MLTAGPLSQKKTKRHAGPPPIDTSSLYYGSLRHSQIQKVVWTQSKNPGRPKRKPKSYI